MHDQGTEPSGGDRGAETKARIRELEGRVLEELQMRLEADLAYPDVLAMTTAIQKAVRKGTLIGVATHSGAVNEVWSRDLEAMRAANPGVDLPESLDVFFPELEGKNLDAELDAWADEFGGDEDES